MISEIAIDSQVAACMIDCIQSKSVEQSKRKLSALFQSIPSTQEALQSFVVQLFLLQIQLGVYNPQVCGPELFENEKNAAKSLEETTGRQTEERNSYMNRPSLLGTVPLNISHGAYDFNNKAESEIEDGSISEDSVDADKNHSQIQDLWSQTLEQKEYLQLEELGFKEETLTIDPVSLDSTQPTYQDLFNKLVEDVESVQNSVSLNTSNPKSPDNSPRNPDCRMIEKVLETIVGDSNETHFTDKMIMEVVETALAKAPETYVDVTLNNLPELRNKIKSNALHLFSGTIIDVDNCVLLVDLIDSALRGMHFGFSESPYEPEKSIDLKSPGKSIKFSDSVSSSSIPAKTRIQTDEEDIIKVDDLPYEFVGYTPKGTVHSEFDFFHGYGDDSTDGSDDDIGSSSLLVVGTVDQSNPVSTSNKTYIPDISKSDRNLSPREMAYVVSSLDSNIESPPSHSDRKGPQYNEDGSIKLTSNSDLNSMILKSYREIVQKYSSGSSLDEALNIIESSASKNRSPTHNTSTQTLRSSKTSPAVISPSLTTSTTEILPKTTDSDKTLRRATVISREKSTTPTMTCRSKKPTNQPSMVSIKPNDSKVHSSVQSTGFLSRPSSRPRSRANKKTSEPTIKRSTSPTIALSDVVSSIKAKLDTAQSNSRPSSKKRHTKLSDIQRSITPKLGINDNKRVNNVLSTSENKKVAKRSTSRPRP